MLIGDSLPDASEKNEEAMHLTEEKRVSPLDAKLVLDSVEEMNENGSGKVWNEFFYCDKRSYELFFIVFVSVSFP